MDVRTCRKCGRVFNYLSGQPLCETCKAELEDKYKEVREYIRANPRATMQQISEENEVSTKQLQQWIREERLSFSDDSPIGLECENCGAMIRTGRFCPTCKKSLGDGLMDTIRPKRSIQQVKKQDDGKNKMRFL